MCGRYVSSSSADQIADYFDVAETDTPDLGARYNVAPTSEVYAVGGRRPDDLDPDQPPVRVLRALRWGLVPFWAKDVSVGNRMINARAESLATKPAYRKAFERRRCLIPADGFYEWRAVPGHKRKQPVYLHRADGDPLAFAGLWERWRDAEGNELQTCVIITTDANATVRPVHDRMPVILPPASWNEWLDPAVLDTDRLAPLLVPAPEGLLTLHEVGLDVNKVGNDGPELVAPAPPTDVAT